MIGFRGSLRLFFAIVSLLLIYLLANSEFLLGLLLNGPYWVIYLAYCGLRYLLVAVIEDGRTLFYLLLVACAGLLTFLVGLGPLAADNHVTLWGRIQIAGGVWILPTVFYAAMLRFRRIDLPSYLAFLPTECILTVLFTAYAFSWILLLTGGAFI
jgi:hypothetical protein